MNTACNMKVRIVTAALILVAGISWCAEPENPLVDRWLLQRIGIRDLTKVPIQIEWEFTKDKVIVRDLTNSHEVSRNSYTLDKTKDPKWLTVTVRTEVRPGIFRIVGDELHLKQAVGGGERPVDFPKDDYLIMKRNGQKSGVPNGS
jgi:uncharacterized protein (TIGR03067 family)